MSIKNMRFFILTSIMFVFIFSAVGQLNQEKDLYDLAQDNYKGGDYKDALNYIDEFISIDENSYKPAHGNSMEKFIY